jgi:hypothetical protein
MRTVLLRHDLRDGSSHYDWMVARPDAPDRLLSFRVLEQIDSGEVVDFLAEPIGDHRADYLDYEGEVSGGRGRVSRVAEGELEVVLGPEELVLRGQLGRAVGVFRGWREGNAWRFRLERAEGTAGAILVCPAE